LTPKASAIPKDTADAAARTVPHHALRVECRESGTGLPGHSIDATRAALVLQHLRQMLSRPLLVFRMPAMSVWTMSCPFSACLSIACMVASLPLLVARIRVAACIARQYGYLHFFRPRARSLARVHPRPGWALAMCPHMARFRRPQSSHGSPIPHSAHSQHRWSAGISLARFRHHCLTGAALLPRCRIEIVPPAEVAELCHWQGPVRSSGVGFNPLRAQRTRPNLYQLPFPPPSLVPCFILVHVTFHCLL